MTKHTKIPVWQQDELFLRAHPEFELFMFDLKTLYVGHMVWRSHVVLDEITAHQAYEHIVTDKCEKCRDGLRQLIRQSCGSLSEGPLLVGARKILKKINGEGTHIDAPKDGANVISFAQRKKNRE